MVCIGNLLKNERRSAQQPPDRTPKTREWTTNRRSGYWSGTAKKRASDSGK
jgi:hypothetical protein